ncbi:hypothetical protein Bxe_C1101 [Paraburkholderia xenovorans LB400]|uniref:Uncharacterized protein n=1 Tax=Paraburkholderia xenovorans (strain LB400) TaxID=266265 RepID=Q13G22_PARXL|nr:hypothetical protein Bxe_C1101 [Paraburkholderia xenovorans LB400]
MPALSGAAFPATLRPKRLHQVTRHVRFVRCPRSVAGGGGVNIKIFSKRLRMRLKNRCARPLTGSCTNKTFRQLYPRHAKRPIPSSAREFGKRPKMPTRCTM